MVLGLVSEGWGHLRKIAEGIPEEGSYNTVRQRIKHWVSNPQLGVADVWRGTDGAARGRDEVRRSVWRDAGFLGVCGASHLVAVAVLLYH